MSSSGDFVATGILQKAGAVGAVGAVGAGCDNHPANQAASLAAVEAANRVADALLELELLGYEFELVGLPGEVRLRYRCTRTRRPGPGVVRPRLDIIKAGRTEAVWYLRSQREATGQRFAPVPYLELAADRAFENGLRLLDAGQEEEAAYEFGRCVRLREAVRAKPVRG